HPVFVQMEVLLRYLPGQSSSAYWQQSMTRMGRPWTTSWVFKNGHKIRLSIACSDYPTFRLHPQLAPGNDPENPNNIVPTITVLFGNGYDSFLELPVIPE
ncbi:MAG: hypothetical protein QGF54_06435, partial [Candidatus Marinimicrobia bacterium]|nr:hypothetical protein [Candidatus Neomarinimicrobiota bacterium]